MRTYACLGSVQTGLHIVMPTSTGSRRLAPEVSLEIVTT